MIRHMITAVLIVSVLTGCTTTYRSADRWNPRPQERFDADLAACGGPPQTVVSPLIMMPLLVGGLIAIREAQKACMAKRGWVVVDEPASHQRDSGTISGLP